MLKYLDLGEWEGRLVASDSINMAGCGADTLILGGNYAVFECPLPSPISMLPTPSLTLTLLPLSNTY